MLQKKTVKRTTLELLTKLMNDPMLSQFNLAGGTALSLYLGHRKSIDLDLFTQEPFKTSSLERYMRETYGLKTDFAQGHTLKGLIEDVKLDCIRFEYPNIQEPYISEEGIRLYGIKDIAAMKLSAIADNGTRLKDFIDIACLSTRIPLSDMIQAYANKFQNVNPTRALRGLTYFEDINFNEPIVMIEGKYSWKLIEKRIKDMIENKEKIFKTFPTEKLSKTNTMKP